MTNVSRLPPPWRNTVLIAGAGICGLATALALARQGRAVQVFESRRDPRGPRCAASARRSVRLAAAAGRVAQRGDAKRAQRLFDAAARASSGLWGQRHRNLLFDHHSVDYLRQLGVATDRLPPITSFDTHLGPGQPSVSIRYGERRSRNGSGRLDAATIIAQRDPVSAPAIHDVETLLLEAAEAHPNIHVRFDVQTGGYEESGERVRLQLDDEAQHQVDGAMLILADGGGRRSLSRRLGIERIEVGREAMNIASFQCDPDDDVLGHSLGDAWLAAHTTPQGWVVFLCSGKGRLTVNTRRVVDSESATGLDIARRHGVRGDLLEQPADFQYALDRTGEFVIGDRVFLVGDTACRASPIWAFGAQFALLWSQMIADLCKSGPVDECGPPVAELARYRAEAARISRMRLEFESSVIELVDYTNAGVREVSDIAMSENLFAALDEVELHFNAASPCGGGLDLRLGINLEALIGASDKPDLSAFCQAVGRFDIDGAMALEFDGKGNGRAQAMGDRAMHYRTRLEDIRMGDGQLQIRRDPAGYWSLTMENVHLQRRVRESGSDTSAGIASAQLRLPDEFVTDLLKQMGPRLWALGAIRRRPLQFDLALAPGLMTLGSFQLRLHGQPAARVTLQREHTGSRFRFELRRGSASVVDFADFVRQSSLSATRLIRGGQRLFGGLVDPFINAWSTGASHFVRRVDFKLNADGRGTAIYYVMGVAVPVPMTEHDVQQLIGELFNSQSCEQIMRQYQDRLVAADIAPRAEAS